MNLIKHLTSEPTPTDSNEGEEILLTFLLQQTPATPSTPEMFPTA